MSFLYLLNAWWLRFHYFHVSSFMLSLKDGKFPMMQLFLLVEALKIRQREVIFVLFIILKHSTMKNRCPYFLLFLNKLLNSEVPFWPLECFRNLTSHLHLLHQLHPPCFLPSNKNCFHFSLASPCLSMISPVAHPHSPPPALHFPRDFIILGYVAMVQITMRKNIMDVLLNLTELLWWKPSLVTAPLITNTISS